MNQSFYRQACQRLNRCTPLPFDCGRFCGRACCRGLDEEAGMWLFPGEESWLAGEETFKIQPLGLRLSNGRPLYRLVCSGDCRREARPLACRIFPLTPRLTAKEVIVVEFDPRAKSICPLAQSEFLEPGFRRMVGRVCRELAREEEVLEFIRLLTTQVAEFCNLAQIFGANL